MSDFTEIPQKNEHITSYMKYEILLTTSWNIWSVKNIH